MTVYYTTEPMESKQFLQRVFDREGITLPVLRTPNGKPCFSDASAPKFNVTHTDGLTAVAVGGQEVGLDAERRRPRRTGAIENRLTMSEREEDFLILWTAKEAYIKFRGATLAEFLPRLVYEKNVLYLDGKPVNATLQHFELEGCDLCLCTKTSEQVEFVKVI